MGVSQNPHGQERKSEGAADTARRTPSEALGQFCGYREKLKNVVGWSHESVGPADAIVRLGSSGNRIVGRA
jgi:hypothetical protein